MKALLFIKRIILIVLLIMMCILLASCKERISYHEPSTMYEDFAIDEVAERG